jgi:hypothetical protein
MQVTTCGSGEREEEGRYFSLFQTGPGVHPASLSTNFTVELTLCLTNKICSTKTYGGVNVYIHVLLTSALAGGEWSV